MSKRPKFPTRRPCADCHTTKGRLRKECPYCGQPVCNDCYPEKHQHRHDVEGPISEDEARQNVIDAGGF